ELAYLSVYMPDKKLRDRADKAVRTILTQGRAPGYAICAALQDPRVESCGYRNLFPLRIAGGLNEPRQVDMVLGEGMHDAGAYCERIPLGKDGAGVAYVLDAEHMMKPLLVRAPWCDDEVIKRVLLQIGERTVSTGNQVKDENLSGQQGWTIQVSQQLNFR